MSLAAMANSQNMPFGRGGAAFRRKRMLYWRASKPLLLLLFVALIFVCYWFQFSMPAIVAVFIVYILILDQFRKKASAYSVAYYRSLGHDEFASEIRSMRPFGIPIDTWGRKVGEDRIIPVVTIGRTDLEPEKLFDSSIVSNLEARVFFWKVVEIITTILGVIAVIALSFSEAEVWQEFLLVFGLVLTFSIVGILRKAAHIDLYVATGHTEQEAQTKYGLELSGDGDGDGSD